MFEAAGRYSRQTMLKGFGTEKQEKLRHAKVLVVGAGGLGVPVLQYLCAMGTGTVGFVENDVVALSNLHRQVLYSHADIGQPKGEIALQKLRAQNPEITVRWHSERLEPANALSIISAYDLVIDCTDNFPTRYLVNDACVLLKKPFIYGAIHEFEGQVSTFNYEGGPTYRCLFAEPPAEGSVRSCAENGVLGVLPGMVGNLQAMEAIKVICGLGEPLKGKLMIINVLENRQMIIKFPLRPQNLLISQLASAYQTTCTLPESNVINSSDLRQWIAHEKAFTLVDVRSAQEFEQGSLPNSLHLPLARFQSEMQKLPANKPIVLLCQQGVRSLQAAQWYLEAYPKATAYSLKGGLNAYFQQPTNG